MFPALRKPTNAIDADGHATVKADETLEERFLQCILQFSMKTEIFLQGGRGEALAVSNNLPDRQSWPHWMMFSSQ
jgi:hypothetical protein